MCNPAKLNGKAVEDVRLFVGGSIGVSLGIIVVRVCCCWHLHARVVVAADLTCAAGSSG